MGNNYGAVIDGRGATVALFHPSAAANAVSSTRRSRLKRRARTAPHELGHVAHDQRKTRAHDQATPRYLRTVTEYSFRGLFTLEGTLFRGLTDQGFEAWPVEGSTGAQITRVRDCMDVPYKLPSNTEFETSYVVFKASRGCLEGGSHQGRA